MYEDNLNNKVLTYLLTILNNVKYITSNKL